MISVVLSLGLMSIEKSNFWTTFASPFGAMLQEPPGQGGLEADNLPDIFGSSMQGGCSATSTAAFAMQETEANRFSKHPLMPSDCVGTNGFGVSNIVERGSREELAVKNRRKEQNCDTSWCKIRSVTNFFNMTGMWTQKMEGMFKIGGKFLNLVGSSESFQRMSFRNVHSVRILKFVTKKWHQI